MTDDAVPLRAYLESLIREGDDRLEKHISQQIQQVKEQYQHVQTALISADKLELARLDALERQITLQLASRDVAIGKAEAASEKRFENVNEFRGQLADQAATFLPREVYETQHADTIRALNACMKQLDELRGQAAGTKSAIGVMISVAVIVISVASFLANYITSH